MSFDNENLYDRLRKLQIIPGAYENWKAYRDELTGCIVNVTEPGGTLAILGAGNCNDIDLELLTTHFSSISLYDMDGDSMLQAISHINAEKTENGFVKNGCRLQAVTADFVGISEQDYREYADELIFYIRENQLKQDFGGLADLAVSFISKVYRKCSANWELQRCDYVISAGVHSQLNNMFAFIWQMIEKSLSESGIKIADSESVYRCISNANAGFVKAYNDNILNAFNKAAFICTEDKNVNSGSLVEGSRQCIEDLWKRSENQEINGREKMLRWNFDSARGVIYDMKLYYITRFN